MSPEQAETDVLGADRSDIYSLGALLYELLTGVTPLDPARLREAGYAQTLKVIREEEPVKPAPVSPIPATRWRPWARA